VTTWVVDTSPLIFLAKLGHLDLLDKGADTVYVPRIVLDEVRAGRDEATQAIEQASLSWLSVRRVRNRGAVEILRADLDLGEAEVIVLAKEVGADKVVMDDLDARRFARRVGLDVIGTMGLLLAARLRGEIPSVRSEIERLEALGFRVAPPLVEAVLKEAGEL
jgi:predicted nucleic acid-binding protein